MLKRIVMLGLVLAALPASLGAAQERNPLILALSTDRAPDDPYLIGEPVLLSLHLTNVSDNAMRLNTTPELESDLLVEVRTPETRPWTEVKNPFPNTIIPRSGFTLLPFETRTFTLMLLYDRTNRDLLVKESPEGNPVPVTWPKLVFDQESPFAIRAKLTVDVDGLYSAYVPAATTIEVKAPVYRSDEDLILTALLLRRDEERLVFQKDLMEAYQRLQATDIEDLAFFEEVLQSFQPNRYTPYFMYLAANSLDFTQPEFRDKAIRLYQRLLSNYPETSLASKSLEKLAVIYDSTDERDKAYQLVQELKNDPEASISNISLVERYVAYSGLEYHPNYWMLIP